MPYTSYTPYTPYTPYTQYAPCTPIYLIYPVCPIHPICPVYMIHQIYLVCLIRCVQLKKAHQVDDQLIMWMTSSCAHASIKNSVVMARRLSWKLLIRWRCISIPYLGALGDSTTLGQIKGGSYEGGNLMYAYIIYMSSSYYTASCMLDPTHAIVPKPLPVLSCDGRVRMPVLCAIGLCPFE